MNFELISFFFSKGLKFPLFAIFIEALNDCNIQSPLRHLWLNKKWSILVCAILDPTMNHTMVHVIFEIIKWWRSWIDWLALVFSTEESLLGILLWKNYAQGCRILFQLCVSQKYLCVGGKECPRGRCAIYGSSSYIT